MDSHRALPAVSSAVEGITNAVLAVPERLWTISWNPDVGQTLALALGVRCSGPSVPPHGSRAPSYVESLESTREAP
jgi:hypothetical protein